MGVFRRRIERPEVMLLRLDAVIDDLASAFMAVGPAIVFADVEGGEVGGSDRFSPHQGEIIHGGEELSHTLPDLNLIWFFWVRLESMWHSNIQHGKTVENDPIMQEIVTMLSYDGSDQGWAVMFKGSAEMAKAKGETFLSCLDKFEEWKEYVGTKGLVQAINEYLQKVQTPHHCNRLILPATTGTIP